MNRICQEQTSVSSEYNFPTFTFMPVLQSDYKAPFILRNAHLNTMIPNTLRKIRDVVYNRLRVELDDGDFIDLDFSYRDSSRLLIILHGLEGNSDRTYARALVKEANLRGFDACVFNQRGCSGELNRLLTSYHSGKSDDLGTVFSWLDTNKKYDSYYLCGVSLGGNISLKYLGENGSLVPDKLKKAAVFSVPVDLMDSSVEMAKPKNFIYLNRLLGSLKHKALAKVDSFPGHGLDREAIASSMDFISFDDAFTAPVHGFSDAKDYYDLSSSKHFIGNITIPTLMINARDDPFFGEACYPIELAEVNDSFHLMIPEYGGHVGFMDRFPLSSAQWVERTVLDFLG